MALTLLTAFPFLLSLVFLVAQEPASLGRGRRDRIRESEVSPPDLGRTILAAITGALAVAVGQRLIFGEVSDGLTTGAAIAAALVVSRISTGAWRAR